MTSTMQDQIQEQIEKSLLSSVRKGQEREQVLQNLKDVQVVREGNTIFVPPGMTMDVAIEALRRQRDTEEKINEPSFDFHLTVPEGALALFNTLKEMYNFVDVSSGWGGEVTVHVVQVAKDRTQSIPWGKLTVPGLSGHLIPGICWINDIPFFRLSAAVPGREMPKVHAIVDAIKARTDSIYRGRSISVKFPKPSPSVQLTDFFPQFLDIPSIRREQLIFSDEIEGQLDESLFLPVINTQHFRDNDIPLKIGVMLEGPPGVGKTLTATVAAKICEDNGWTFIRMHDVRDLPKIYAFAAHHQPAMIFGEDLDEHLKEEKQRDAVINGILNSLDGVDSKNVEIVVVFTTNNVGLITKPMLRPQRLDAVISMRAPDAKAVQRLIRSYAGDKLEVCEDLTRVGELLAGRNAAIVREVVERSKRSATRHLSFKGQQLRITASDLETAAQGMKSHIELLEPKPIDRREPLERGLDHLAEAIRGITAPRAPANGIPLLYPGATPAVDRLPSPKTEDQPPA